jgi:hypothetical protein
LSGDGFANLFAISLENEAAFDLGSLPFNSSTLKVSVAAAVGPA